MTVIIIVILLVLLFGALPSWPHSQSYGWGLYPSSLLGVVLLILVVLWLLGKIH